MIILDTSALIFWTLNREALSPKAEKAIAEAESIAISSISIWETGIKTKKEKLDLPISITEYVEKLKTVEGFEILPVDERTWLKNLELDWEHKDPADRTIVATASLLASPLVTSDKRMIDFYSETIR